MLYNNNKTVHTNLFTKICNMQIEFRKITPFGLILVQDIQADFEINRPVQIMNYHENKLFPQTTDGRTSRKTKIGSFFEKRKNY